MNNDLLKAAMYNMENNDFSNNIVLASVASSGLPKAEVMQTAIEQAHADNPAVTDNNQLAELATSVIISHF